MSRFLAILLSLVILCVIPTRAGGPEPDQRLNAALERQKARTTETLGPALQLQESLATQETKLREEIAGERVRLAGWTAAEVVVQGAQPGGVWGLTGATCFLLGGLLVLARNQRRWGLSALRMLLATVLALLLVALLQLPAFAQEGTGSNLAGDAYGTDFDGLLTDLTEMSRRQGVDKALYMLEHLRTPRILLPRLAVKTAGLTPVWDVQPGTVAFYYSLGCLYIEKGDPARARAKFLRIPAECKHPSAEDFDLVKKVLEWARTEDPELADAMADYLVRHLPDTPRLVDMYVYFQDRGLQAKAAAARKRAEAQAATWRLSDCAALLRIPDPALRSKMMKRITDVVRTPAQVEEMLAALRDGNPGDADRIIHAGIDNNNRIIFREYGEVPSGLSITRNGFLNQRTKSDAVARSDGRPLSSFRVRHDVGDADRVFVLDGSLRVRNTKDVAAAKKNGGVLYEASGSGNAEVDIPVGRDIRSLCLVLYGNTRGNTGEFAVDEMKAILQIHQFDFSSILDVAGVGLKHGRTLAAKKGLTKHLQAGSDEQLYELIRRFRDTELLPTCNKAAEVLLARTGDSADARMRLFRFTMEQRLYGAAGTVLASLSKRFPDAIRNEVAVDPGILPESTLIGKDPIPLPLLLAVLQQRNGLAAAAGKQYARASLASLEAGLMRGEIDGDRTVLLYHLQFLSRAGKSATAKLLESVIAVVEESQLQRELAELKQANETRVAGLEKMAAERRTATRDADEARTAFYAESGRLGALCGVAILMVGIAGWRGWRHASSVPDFCFYAFTLKFVETLSFELCLTVVALPVGLLGLFVSQMLMVPQAIHTCLEAPQGPFPIQGEVTWREPDPAWSEELVQVATPSGNGSGVPVAP